MTRKISILLCGLLTCLCFAGASACDIPVFRYALERWPAERYRLEVFTGTEMTARQTGALKLLRSLASGPDNYANIDLHLSDHLPDGEPSIVLSHPLPNGKAIYIWSGKLTETNASQITDSPLRRKISGLLGDGHSAVWVVLLCGDPQKDKAALEKLESAIDELEGTLSLPVAVEEINGEGLPELKVKFSLLALSRDDPNEEILAGMLIASEPDLGSYSDQPIAFPVFGRGRVLYALVGDGIERRNIRDACAFLVGPCACEIKDLSPGMDLLMAADWAKLAGKSWVDRINGGPLTSLAAFMGISRENAGNASNSESRFSGLGFSILSAVAAVLLIVVVVSLRIVKSSKAGDK
ncbi:hypothetical protein ACFL4X_00525 [Gemmatimonadota bacterium]